MASELSLLLHQKLGVRGGGLEAKLARAGRLLPRRIRADASEIIEAEKREGNPRLARQTDPAALARAYKSVETHLQKIDVADRRRGKILSVLASIAFGLIVVASLLLTYLVQRGHL